MLIIEPPYLDKNNAIKSVNANSLSDKFARTTFRRKIRIILCFIMGFILLCLEPLFKTIAFLFLQIIYRREYKSPTNQQVIQRHTCNQTGRSYVVRRYSSQRDAVDAPQLFSTGFAVDRFFNYLNPHPLLRHQYSQDFFKINIENGSNVTFVQEWEEQEKLVGAIIFSIAKPSLISSLIDEIRTASYLIKLGTIHFGCACRMINTFLSLYEKFNSVSSQFDVKTCVLKFAAVEKGFQGQGIGSNLLKILNSHLDEAGINSYLESSASSNIPVYERHGYRVFEEFKPTPDSPVLYLMFRKALKPSTGSSNSAEQDSPLEIRQRHVVNDLGTS